ncbi:sugar porter family MFS transporter [Aureobasidium subglaciale]|nr:sugar porter family MFS transporter [Aureobasidium subglaciale]
MADTRTFSIAGDEDTKRNGSITAGDMHHLARVDTAIAGEAARATQSEISMTLLQGIKTYPKAIGWSILLSTCIIMEGFDIVLINSLMALPAFQLRFGEPSADGSYQISAAWQSGLSNGALVGEVIGLLFIGYIVERIGYKKTMIGSLVGLTGFIFIVFFAQSLPMLLVGEILMGIPCLRAYLTMYVNLCWVIGQFLSSAVLKAVADKTGPIGYKLPYGLQWIWPLPLIIGIALAPESPWWLVRQGRREEAKAQVLRLTSRNQTDSGFNVDETVNMMVYTDELEKASTFGTSYLDCFKGTDRRRTEIIAMASILMIVGFLGIAPASAAGAHWGIGAMILIYTFIYDTTVGPVCYSLVAEIPSTRLRNKTVVLARNLYNITGVVANILTPHMLNPDAWNWGAKAGFFWAGTGALCAVWT